MACAQAAESTSPDVNPLVIADAKWENEHIDKICLGTEADGIPKLKELGFVLVKRGKDSFLIAPSIWQQSEMDRMLGVYKGIEADLRDDKTLDLSHDPNLRDFIQASFGADGSEIGSDTTVSVGTHRSYELAVGDKNISVHGGNVSKYPNSELRKHPVAHHDQPLSSKVPAGGYRPMWPYQYVTLGFHGIVSDGRRRMEMFSSGLQLIREHFDSFDQARKAARGRLGSLVGGDPSKIIGQGYAGLPQDLQDDLRNELTNNFGNYGFASAADAMAFLNGSTLAGTDAGIMLTVSLGDYQGTPLFHGKEIP